MNGQKALIKPTGYTYFWIAYNKVYKEGQKRFASICLHKRIKNNYCQNCLRKVN